MFTLRYQADTPIYPRPHGPTLAVFSTRAEAIDHLEEQPADLMLEVVER